MISLRWAIFFRHPVNLNKHVVTAETMSIEKQTSCAQHVTYYNDILITELDQKINFAQQLANS